MSMRNARERSDECSERRHAIGVDLEPEEIVGARPPAVDRDDGFAKLACPFAKAIARIGHQRRADNQYGIRSVERLESRLDARPRHAVAEEDDVGFEHAAAIGALRHGEGLEVEFRIRVAVGRDARRNVRERGVRLLHRCLQRPACELRPAAEAYDLIETAVKIEHAPAPGALMQTIDVLGHQPAHAAEALERCKCRMRGVRYRGGNGRPTYQASRPVALPRRLAADEFLVSDWRLAAPIAVNVSIPRNTGSRADARAGQDEKSRMVAEKSFETG